MSRFVSQTDGSSLKGKFMPYLFLERGDFTRTPPAPEPMTSYGNIVPIRTATQMAEVSSLPVTNAMYCLMVRERVTSRLHFHTANDTRLVLVPYSHSLY